MAGSLAIVADVLATEIDRRRAEAAPQLLLIPVTPPLAASEPIASAAPLAAPSLPTSPPSPPAQPAPLPTSGGRGRWTHATVIEELATWLMGGSTVEASYVRRHGPPGLAAAAKRLFGRFDAALNAANLVLAQRFPAGPPSRRSTGLRLPTKPRDHLVRNPPIGEQRQVTEVVEQNLVDAVDPSVASAGDQRI